MQHSRTLETDKVWNENTMNILEWADENILKAECVTYAIADTGDYDSMWHVEDIYGRKSYGKTLPEAIQDATKGDDDPTRYDYVPPEFR